MTSSPIAHGSAAEVNRYLAEFEPEFPKRACGPLFAEVYERVAKDPSLFRAVIPGILSLARFYNYGVPSWDKPSILQNMFGMIFPSEDLKDAKMALSITPEALENFTKIISGKIDGPAGHVAMAVPIPQHMSFLFADKYLKPLLALRPELTTAVVKGTLPDGWEGGIEQSMAAAVIIRMVAKNPTTREYISDERFSMFAAAVAKTPIGQETLKEMAKLDERFARIIEENGRRDDARSGAWQRVRHFLGAVAASAPLPR